MGVVDLLAETSLRWSTYAYAVNTPVNAIDPGGKDKNFEISNSRKVAEVRNRIIHGYVSVSNNIFWQLLLNMHLFYKVISSFTSSKTTR